MAKEKTTYSEKLKDPRWQKQRLEIFERDEWQCQHCGDMGSPLNVHHFAYEKGKQPWEYANDQLLTLCENCHEEEYKFSYPAKLALNKAISKCGFSVNDIICMAACFEILSKNMPKNLAIEQTRSAICFPLTRPEVLQELLDRDRDEFMEEAGKSMTSSFHAEVNKIRSEIYGPDEY